MMTADYYTLQLGLCPKPVYYISCGFCKANLQQTIIDDNVNKQAGL